MNICFYKDGRGRKAAEGVLRCAHKRVQCLAVHCVQAYAYHEFWYDLPWCHHVIGALCALRIQRCLVLYCARTPDGVFLFDGAPFKSMALGRRVRRRAMRNYYNVIRKE